MSYETRRNIREAHHLFTQAKKSGLNYGCVEVSLQALGGSAHLVDLLRENPTDSSDIYDVIQRSGFQSNWLITTDSTFTARHYKEMFLGEVPQVGKQPAGRMAGYIGMAYFPQGNQINHVIGIVPRQHLSRNQRIEFKKLDSQFVIDTSSGGILRVPHQSFVNYGNMVRSNQGSFLVSQLWHMK